jgi:hypothetical protein
MACGRDNVTEGDAPRHVRRASSRQSTNYVDKSNLKKRSPPDMRGTRCSLASCVEVSGAGGTIAGEEFAMSLSHKIAADLDMVTCEDSKNSIQHRRGGSCRRTEAPWE